MVSNSSNVILPKKKLGALAQMVVCLPLVQQDRGSISGGVVNFHLKIFNFQEGWRCTLSNRQIVHHSPGLNCKPFRSTVDSDSSVGWGRQAWRPPWCFSRRAGYERHRFSPFPFLSSSSHTAQLQYTNSYTHSHPNLNFLEYTIQILIPHVMWSAQAVRDTKIDHSQRHLSALRGTQSA